MDEARRKESNISAKARGIRRMVGSTFEEDEEEREFSEEREREELYAPYYIKIWDPSNPKRYWLKEGFWGKGGMVEYKKEARRWKKLEDASKEADKIADSKNPKIDGMVVSVYQDVEDVGSSYERIVGKPKGVEWEYGKKY